MSASAHKTEFSEAHQEPYIAPVAEVTVHEAKTHLSRLLAQVESGATIVITRRGKPVATLQRIEPRPKRVFGSMKGQIAFDNSFFDPLPDDLLEAWGET